MRERIAFFQSGAVPWHRSNPDAPVSFGAHSGMKRPAQPEEISQAYVFLASPVCAS
jgi:hypothetical protein